ncbi:hypothetical protein FTV88_0693 [Heliorestis convoluta]|uniref:Uncharacterized protein n=1 Tax=Heliorestis convoluta TaxID=356322 RepID=A0A5Q2MY73_9FIRM|nr:hypothetical protein FTV88_0693 [Heliorestis convoluta]
MREYESVPKDNIEKEIKKHISLISYYFHVGFTLFLLFLL